MPKSLGALGISQRIHEFVRVLGKHCTLRFSIPVAGFLPPNNEGDGSARDANGATTGTDESL